MYDLKWYYALTLLTAGIVFILAMMISCTISFQNISTHGSASDLVDEDQKADPTISPNIEIPISPI